MKKENRMRYINKKCKKIFKEIKKNDKHNQLPDDLSRCLEFMEKDFAPVIKEYKLYPYTPTIKYQTNAVGHKKIRFDIYWIEDLYVDMTPGAKDAFTFKLGHEIGHKKCTKVDKAGDFWLFTFIIGVISVIFGISIAIWLKKEFWISCGVVIVAALAAAMVLIGGVFRKIIIFEQHVCECHADFCGIDKMEKKEKMDIKNALTWIHKRCNSMDLFEKDYYTHPSTEKRCNYLMHGIFDDTVIKNIADDVLGDQKGLLANWYVEIVILYYKKEKIFIKEKNLTKNLT